VHWVICISEHKVPKYPASYGFKFGKESKLKFKICGVWGKVPTRKVVPNHPIHLNDLSWDFTASLGSFLVQESNSVYKKFGKSFSGGTCASAASIPPSPTCQLPPLLNIVACCLLPALFPPHYAAVLRPPPCTHTQEPRAPHPTSSLTLPEAKSSPHLYALDRCGMKLMPPLTGERHPRAILLPSSTSPHP
jgi:hypothetical protein